MSSQPISVFLVEDSPSFRGLLTELIAIPGRIEVIGSADSEAAAVAQIANLHPDVVIADISLREGNGLNVIQTARVMKGMSTATLMILTNYALPGLRQKSSQLGADYFFDKSNEYLQVIEVLGELAKRRFTD